MIDTNNTKLHLIPRRNPSGVEVTAELVISLQHYVGPDWSSHLDNPQLWNSIESHFRDRFQEIIYGDLIDSIVTAYGTALRAAWPGEMYETVKQDFEPVFRKLKVPIPAEPFKRP